MDASVEAFSLEVHTDFENQLSQRLQTVSNVRYSFEFMSTDENLDQNAILSTNLVNNSEVRTSRFQNLSVQVLPQQQQFNHIKTTTSTNNRSCIVSIVEGRGLAKGEVGIAQIDLIGSSLILSQFSDNISYHRLMAKLDIYNPVELILPSTIADEKTNALSVQIKRKFRETQVTGTERKWFNEADGYECVKKLCNSSIEKLEVVLRNKYYCLSACAALIKYVESVQNITYAEKSLNVEYRSSEDTMIIDFATARSLEIIVTQTSSKNDDTLYGVLNNTKTRSGSRLLRATLMEPSSNIYTIETRVECVEELSNSQILRELSCTLSCFVNVEHLISVLVQKPKIENEKTCKRKIDAAILLKSTLEFIPQLINVLNCLKHPLFQCYKTTLGHPNYTKLKRIIDEVILDKNELFISANKFKIQKCFAIREDICPRLKISRKTFSERIEDVFQLQSELMMKHKVELHVGYTVKRGYYFYINQTRTPLTARQLPNEFTKVIQKGKNLQFLTKELVKTNNRVSIVMKDILNDSTQVINHLFIKIFDYIPYLQKLAEIIAHVDLIASFALAAIKYELVKPDFGDSLDIVEGLHPILGKEKNSFVVNDISMSKRNNLILLTGPNMSGKSTYLKQIALLHIMAQSGSFVPATKASFKIKNQIFSRLGTNDDIESNSSTFMVEMKEVLYILQNVTKDSLVIIDELGRGTSREDGLGLCIATAEQLIHSDAYTYFVTHFSEVTHLVQNYPTVSLYYFKVDFKNEPQGENIVFTHKIQAGTVPEIDCAIKLAELNLFPEVVKEARDFWRQSRSPETCHKFSNNLDFKLGNFLLDLSANPERETQETIKYILYFVPTSIKSQE